MRIASPRPTEIELAFAAGTTERGDQSHLESGWQLLVMGLALATLLAMCLAVPSARGQANVKGQWQTLSTQMPINPVHVALMPNGKVLVVSGSGNYPPNTNYAAAVWDPATSTVTTQPVGWDMFCNGMLVLPDGRPLVVGGTLQYDPFHGWKRTSAYDPATGKFVDMQDMAHGRWYPTTTELGDGRFMTFSGLDENGNTNTQVEIYKLGVGWGSPATAQWTPDLYPRLHLLPNGTVFYSGANTQSRTFNPATNTWSGVVATTIYGGTRTYGTSILFPLTPANGYKPMVAIFGGDSPSTATSEYIDLSVANPVWKSGPPMSQPRIEMNGTMLPNGKVVLVGGSLNDEDTGTASLNADLYDTSTNTMSSAGANAFPRLYHSVSLLLPDGTVWLTGGNPARGSYEPEVEIYSPAYLFNADGTLATRPTITAVTPNVIGYGTSFQVQTPDAANITSVVLMKNGATTHAFNMDQRMVGLSYTAGSGVLNVTGPPSGNIAPPGYYMLFLINSAGVPSVAKFVQVSTAPTDIPPTGTITSPASDVFITPGGSVSFAGSGTAPSGSISSYSWVFRGGSPAASSLANPGTVTFATAGTYTVSLTVTDNAGITDPSPKTRTITVTNTPAPILTAASPNSGTQNQANLNVVLTGSKFVSGASCNFGAGININSCTFNSTTQITANINILGTAPTGGHNVIVTNPDGQSSTLANGFTVQQGIPNPPPTITGANPNSGAQGQTNITVILAGTNFLPNPACDFDSDQGLTTNSCTYNSPTQITANITVALNAVTGGHNIVVMDTDGQSATLVNGFTVNALTGNAINLGNGFTAGSVVLNGSAKLNGKNLELTDLGSTEASSAWYPSPVNIQSFTTNFSFQQTAGTDTADGMTFTIQGNTTAALGPEGGGLGYGPDAPTNPSQSAHTPIGKSVAVKFDLYDNNGEGPDSTGIYTNGASPTTPAVDMTGSGIDLHSGDVFNVQFTYDGTNLAMTITDTTTNAKFTQTWPINIPAIVGGNLAYAGFTAGTGGLSSVQNVLSWTLSSTTPGGTATPSFSLPGGTYLGTQTVSLSDLTTGATIFYTLDGTTPATTVGGSTQQYTGPITVSSTETIKAIATAPGLATSPMTSASYVIESQVATPVFSPLPGTYTSVQSVGLSTTTSGASIYYTTNNTTPTTSSTLYSGPITVGTTETIQAIAAEAGFFNSTVASGLFTINLPVVATPVITPATGTYTSAQTATITDTTPGAAIYYTTNGSTPTTSSTLYVGGFQVNTTTTVKAIAVASGFANSIVATSVITLNIPTTATPAVTPATGTYTTPQTVNITDTTTGAVIYYTTDGTTPTTNSAQFPGAFGINATTTVKALAAASGFNNSAVGTSVITINLPTAATPVITPATGTYTSPQSATITDTSAGATIFYTTDGSTATTSSTVYSAAIPVGSTTTIKAIAGGPAFKTSAVRTSTITINLPTAATPVITPATGTFTTPQTATITDTSTGATIFYTTDGSTPTTSSTVYSAAIPVGSTTTIKAVAGGPAFKTSAVRTSTITINLPTAATPVITPATGTYTSPQSATITDTSAGATIFYTTDGSTPTTSSTVYSTAIPVGSTMTIKAIAGGPAFKTSAVRTSTITINLPAAATPVISPATGNYTLAQTVTITDTTTGATIYYTKDGSTPTVNSTQYTGSFSVSSTTTVKAIAVASGFTNSALATSVITITPPAAVPVIAPATGTYTTTQSATITDASAGTTIYYTLDGSTPTTSSTVYTAAIPVGATTTVKAIAAGGAFSSSPVATSVITINLPVATVPVISPVTGTYTTPQSASITDVTPGAVIYFTLDGTNPTSNSAVYNTAIPVNSTTTVKAIAAASGFANSGIATSVITINLPVTATPVISPAGGPYQTAQTVTITDATAGSTIYYTTDGSTPTTGSTQYTNPILVSTSQTINALAAASGNANSNVATAVYSIGVATPTLVQFTSGSNTQGNSTGSYLISLPNPSLPGNLLACGFTRESGTATTTVSDDRGQTWTAGPTNTDTINGELSALYYFPNTTAGVRQITIHFSAQKQFIAAACWEFYNVALTSPADGSAGHSDLGNPSTTVTSGSFTTGTAGDLILMYGFRDGGNNTVWTQGTSPWKLTSADVADGSFSQYQIQASAGAINPTLTADGQVDWTAVGAGFKAAAAGTAPGAGMRVIGVLHNSINSGSLAFNTGAPTNGNMLVAVYIGPAGLDLCPMSGGTGNCAGKPGVVDSNSNSWTRSGAILAAAGDSQQYYSCNATSGTTMKITFNSNNTITGANLWLYDVAGAASTCFDKQTTTTGTQSGSAGDITGATLTPASANGVLIGSADVANNYMSGTATANCYLDSTVTVPNISADPADQNNGAMHCYPPSASSFTPHWTSSGGPVGGWGNYLVSYNPK